MILRIRRPRHRSSGATLAIVCVTLAAGGCASGGGESLPRTDVSVVPVEPGREQGGVKKAPVPLPALPMGQIAAVDSAADRRVSLLEASNEDLRTVIRGLAESYGLDYRISPEVAGRVTTRLRDVTLREALDAVVLPQGYTYGLEGGVLRVGPATLQTEIYTLDYIALSRVGTGTTIVQRRFGQTGRGNRLGTRTGTGTGTTGVPGGFPGTFGGSDVISSIEVSNLWQDVQVALEGLLFDSSEDGEDRATEARPANIRNNEAPTAYSRNSPDGRRLIINPLAGTILVTAPPAKLAEIEAYLNAFQGSIQRQVAIQARIVEVSLGRQSQFGIDWSAVRQLGDLDLSLRTTPSNAESGGGAVELTLGDGTGVESVVRALETQGEVKVLSSPRVSTLNNQRAIMDVSTDEVFFTVTRQPIPGPDGTTIGFNTEVEPQQVSVGIVLDVFAQVSPDNTITMNIRPVVADVVRVERVRLSDGTQASAPVIERRQTDTIVRVRDGETIVIGGLMQTRNVTEERGVPLLKDIPFLGRLFSTTSVTEEKSELVIFLTPRIVTGQRQAGR